MEQFIKNVLNIHEKIVNDVPTLKEGMVHCSKCGKELKVDSAECLKKGWPKCCGYTMTLGKKDK